MDEEDAQAVKQVVQGEVEGIGASISLGIDQSIDTLRLEEYDYIEEVKFYWTEEQAWDPMVLNSQIIKKRII